jgi:hypothetical protein
MDELEFILSTALSMDLSYFLIKSICLKRLLLGYWKVYGQMAYNNNPKERMMFCNNSKLFELRKTTIVVFKQVIKASIPIINEWHNINE